MIDRSTQLLWAQRGDLATLSLFGSPEETFRKVYNGFLEPGFEYRCAIYQLWPALVYMGLLGDSYRGLVERLLDRCSGCTEIGETAERANLYPSDLLFLLVPMRFLNIENKQFCSCCRTLRHLTT